MRRAGIIGHPVAHSLSPAFQGAAFAACGLDIRYEAWDTPPAQLPGRIEGIRRPEFAGANVTIPHKEAVVPLLDGLAELAALVGAVNTIVQRDGKLTGHNTDGPGFIEALRRERGFEPAGRSVLLLGAGGASRGIAFALAAAGASAIAIWNRTPDRAQRLAADVAATGSAVRTADRADPGGFDLVVNCTSVGMSGTGAAGESPCDLSRARPGTLAVDIVYKPAETPFLGQARAAGLPALGGLPMLIFQGALAFELWTGLAAPVSVMFEAAREALREASA